MKPVVQAIFVLTLFIVLHLAMYQISTLTETSKGENTDSPYQAFSLAASNEEKKIISSNEISMFAAELNKGQEKTSITANLKKSYPVRGFWHVGALYNVSGDNWERVVISQLSAIEQSGIISDGIVSGIDVTIIGQPPPWNIFFSSFYKIDYQGENVEQFEFPTLGRLGAYCKANPSARVLYFHNKGARFSPPRDVVEHWREFMEYYTLHRYQDCLYELERKEIVVCGQAARSGPTIHFAGNFWWAKCEYVNKLPELDRASRHNAEFWIGKGMAHDVKEFNDKSLLPYSSLKGCDTLDTDKNGHGNFYVDDLKPELYKGISACGPSAYLKAQS